MARHIAGISKIRDCTGGFRAVKTSVINLIDWSSINVQGYAFQVAFLHAAISINAKVVEIPINFEDRKFGESKLGFSDIVEFIMNAWWIRFRKQATFLKFSIVGLTGVLINLISFTCLVWLGLNKFVASPIAIELSIISNFLINNFWTLRLRKTNSGIRVKGIKFNFLSILALGVSYTTFLLVILFMPSWPPHFAQALGIPPAMIVNYFLNSRRTFRQADPKG